jgi:serine/threonine protein kinase
MNERKLLAKLQHPFLVNIRYAFQDRDNLYLVSDLLTGGDLRFHIGKRKRFNEVETRFMMGCLILGLEYMHSQSVIHRDMKPENIIMEENGYLRITDFGISKIWKEDNSADTSGTPGYMAPEVMCR